MPLITETYYLSLTQDNRGILRLRCSQDDTLRTVNLKLYNNGSIFVIPSGVSASISGVKQNGAVFSKPCTISQDRESVVLQLSSDITNVDGIIVAEIVLNDGEGGRLGTSNFIIQVEKNPIRVGVIQDTETPIEYINDFIEKIQTLTARLNNLITPSGDPSLAEVVDARIGILDSTTYQTLGARLNAEFQRLSNALVTVDDELSDESENPVQNKVVASAISEINESLPNKIGYSHTGSTSLKNCDLDDIITPGSYRVTSISNARTVTNIPVEQGGVLLVSIMQANTNVWQRYIVLTANNGVRIYDRVQSSGTWKSWFDNTTSLDNAKKLSINNDDYISIQSGSDLNDITTVGSYKSTSSSVTATLLNKPPINVGFLLLVSNVTSNSVFLQVAIGASDTSLVYLRYINPAGDVFGEWHKIQYDDIGIESTLAALGNSITSNTTRISILEAQSGIEGDYFTQFEEQEQALYDKVNNDIDKNTLVFLVSADNHYRETKPEGEYQVYHAEVMAKIAKRLRADAIINLGDIITQYIDSVDDEVYANTDITAEEVNTMRLAKMATAFQSTGVPFLYTLAHHEMSLHNNGPTSTDNTTQTSVYPYPESKVLGLCGKGAEWLEEHHYSQDPLSAGYYVDFSRHKVRLIFIDSVSYSAVGFSPNSIAFITEAFSNVPSGYKVIVCSHTATRGPGVYSSTMKNWEPVENIMSSFVSNGGTILAILHGHAHYDNVVFIENVSYPYICVCCAENSWSTVGEKIEAGVQGNPVSYKAHSATRGDAIGTYNEWLFDIMCVHPDTNTLKFFRFGIGEDRTVVLPTE